MPLATFPSSESVTRNVDFQAVFPITKLVIQLQYVVVSLIDIR